MSLILDPYRFVPSGPTVLASDNFNRANAGSLGTSSSGHAWTDSGGTWTLSGNTAHGPALSGGNYALSSVNAGAADVDITVTVALSGGVDVGIAARVIDSDTFIYMDFTESGADFITRTFQRVGGSFTGLTSLVGPFSATSPITLRLVCVGSSGEAFVQGASVGTWSSLHASLVTPTKHGLAIGSNSSANAYDNFSVAAA